jgi:hypothetical protein
MEAGILAGSFLTNLIWRNAREIGACEKKLIDEKFASSVEIMVAKRKRADLAKMSRTQEKTTSYPDNSHDDRGPLHCFLSYPLACSVFLCVLCVLCERH